MEKLYLRLVTFAIIVGLFVVALHESAEAGELIGSARKIRNSGGISSRVTRSSTSPYKRLNGARSQTRATGLRDSSPYEYRIVQNERNQRNYELKLAKWQSKVDQIEFKARVREKKQLQKQQEKEYKLWEKNKEKQAKLAEKKAKEQAKLAKSQQKTSIFGSSATSTGKGDANQATLSGNGGVEGEAPRRMTLWQRLKAWLGLSK